MPQMMPLFWLYLMLVMIFSLFLVSCMFFYLHLPHLKNELVNLKKIMKWSWKW